MVFPESLASRQGGLSTRVALHMNGYIFVSYRKTVYTEANMALYDWLYINKHMNISGQIKEIHSIQSNS